jgi:hypothetical protein
MDSITPNAIHSVAVTQPQDLSETGVRVDAPAVAVKLEDPDRR